MRLPCDLYAIDSTIQVGRLTPEQVGNYGTLAVSGNFTQLRGTTQFYIAGAAPGNGYGRLQLGGNVSFNDATVNINVVSFQPPIGSRFVLFTAPNANAANPNVTGLDFGSPDRTFQLDLSVQTEFAIECVAVEP